MHAEDTRSDRSHTGSGDESPEVYGIEGGASRDPDHEVSATASNDLHENVAVAEIDAEADPRTRGELLAALVASEQQCDEYLDDLRRARADFENFRRRTSKDLATQRDAGKADLAKALLETLDDLDRTVQAAEASSDDQLAHGVQLVASKLRGTLEHAGLVRIDATNVPFDPQRHEAVAQRPAEGRDDVGAGPIVADVMRPGYEWGERVLRAAMVTVEE
ncbi:MAG: nucleotide exchange factor GrpE [Nitriliruptoraceae bacterium]